MNFQQRIRELCEIKNVTYGELETKSGLCKSSISHIINDKTANPSIKTLKRIIDTLNITEEEFFLGYSTYKLSSREFLLLQSFRKLSEYKQVALLHFLTCDEIPRT